MLLVVTMTQTVLAPPTTAPTKQAAEIDYSLKHLERIPQRVQAHLAERKALASRSAVRTPAPKPEPKETYGEWMDFKMTHYDLSGGSGLGVTYTNTVPKEGRTFAVDKKRIKLRSIIEVRYPDGTIERGIAEDTGGAIKGNKIDKFVNSHAKAVELGVKYVQVRVVHPN